MVAFSRAAGATDRDVVVAATAADAAASAAQATHLSKYHL